MTGEELAWKLIVTVNFLVLMGWGYLIAAMAWERCKQEADA